MTKIKYKGEILYKCFFSPGQIYYYASCLPMPCGFGHVKTLEEAYQQKKRLMAWADQQEIDLRRWRGEEI